MARTSTFALGLAALSFIVVSACSSKPVIVVGSKNFTEQVMLGEIVAQQIERRLEIQVQRKLNLGGTLLTHEAVKAGSLDLYPEYTGTALTAVLKLPTSKDPASVLDQVRQGYKPWNLTWLDPLGFNNTFAMVIRTDAAKGLGGKTLSAAARRPQPWKMGVGYEFMQRPDGLPGLLNAYGLRMDGEALAMDLGLLYPALESGRIEMGAASATDAQLARSEFTVLDDDKSYFPPYQCAIVVRDATLAQHPGLRAVLAELSGAISDADMRRMNAALEREHRPAVDVAREFLNHKFPASK